MPDARLSPPIACEIDAAQHRSWSWLSALAGDFVLAGRTPEALEAAPRHPAGTEPAVGRRPGKAGARWIHARTLAAFTRFLEDGRICLSNNAAERASR
jgi:hypothetical protein